MVAIDNKFEGAYVVRHGGYWYLFASTANCCAGPTTGYSVQVGRSRDLRGPYVDQQGVPLVTSRAGGTPVLTQNGNRWVGRRATTPIAHDVAGQDWIVYHAIDRGRSVPGRHLRHQPAADADGPARLGARLAGGPRRPRAERSSPQPGAGDVDAGFPLRP